MNSASDAEQLRLLSIFHYIVAALAALFALFPVVHLALGLAMVSGQLDGGAGEEPGASLIGWFFVSLATLWIVGGLAFAVGLVFAGRFLARRRRYLYCLVLAALACMFMPFGTVLGVFTIIVLMRPSVKEAFGVATSAR